MQRLIFRRVFSVLIVLVLLISFFLPVRALAESNGIQTDEVETFYLRVVEQTDVYEMEGYVIGKLLEGAVLQVEKVENNRVYFQWNDDLAYVNLQDVEILTEVDNVSWVDPKDFKISNVIEFPKEIEVLDGQDRLKNSPIAMIAAGVSYSVIGEDEQNYYIIIGHRQGTVVKDQLSETVEQPQSTEQTNDPEKGTNQEAVTDEINEESTTKEQSNENQELTSDQKTNPDLKQENEETTKGQARLFTIQNQADSKTSDAAQQSVKFEKIDKYFEVLEDNLPVYDNRTGKLVKIGELKKGQVYPRVSDYGNWHRIQFSDYYGYVKKSETKPANGTSIKNENKSYKNSSKSFKAIENVTVYDNTSGKLVPFGTIEKGKEYKIASDYGNWWRIIFSGRIGYVQKSAVQLPFSQQDKYFEVLEDNLPVYDNRTGKLVKIGELKKGQVYPRVSDYGNWHRIQFSDYYGYVKKSETKPANGTSIKNENKSYKNSSNSFKAIENVTVYDNTSGKLVPFGTIEKGKEYKIASDYGNWWRIIFSGRIGYVQKSAVQLPFSQQDKYFEVLEDNLPVYDNRTGKLVKIGELKKGQVYPTVSDYGNWHRIQFSDYYGYVRKDSTRPANGSSIKNKNSSYKSNGRKITPIQKITVYDNSSGKLVPFGAIEKRKVYKVTSDYGNWWQIVYSGRIGYVNKSDAIAEFFSSDKYFEVIKDNVAVYDNRTGKLVKVGELKKGQIYPRVSDYGNWHRIQFSDYYGYVQKSSTNYPTKKVVLPSENTQYTHSKSQFATIRKVTIYDNKEKVNGKNVPFGTIDAGITYPIAFEYGDWWGIIYSGRIGYVKKTETSTVSEINEVKTLNHYYMKNDNIEAYKNINQLFISPSSNYLESANNILINKYKIGDYGTFSFPDGIVWDKPIVNENERSYLRELNGHFFLSDLIKSYEVTKKETYIKKGYEIIKDWIDNNSYATTSNSMAWHDETTARRLVQWIHFYHHAKNVLSKKDLEILLANITFHAELLSKDSFYAHNTNHGMFQDEALLAFSEYYKAHKKSDYFKNLAKQRLKDYFNFIISEEGVHLEHSPQYHQIIASSLLSYYNLFDKINDTSMKEYLFKKYEKMSDFATFITKPDGVFPAIGDTEYNFKPSSTLWSNDYYKFAVSKGASGKPHPKTDMVFKNSGYAIFRDTWNKGPDSTYVLFTAAYHTGYHKHSDDLNMWIYSKGTDIIVEAGPHGYDYHNAFTEYGYSSFAHNTLIVNDKGLPRHDSQYKKVYIESYQLDKNKAKVRGVNERYKNVKHIRDIQYDKLNQMIEVNDTIQSSVRNNYKLLWHMAEGIEVELEKIHNNAYKVYLFKNENKIATIEVTSESKIELNIVKGQKNPPLGWKLLIKGENVPINTLIISTNDDTAKIKTNFILH
ncbi:alginate lyase family protein [Aeribacillus sp. FSL K6-8394]|uniref:alginate lyase family protein n=1 Tax=Aeribacillus sp. FSL K6-8394 TaxID=2954570 RepID=UPI0030FAD2A0